MCIHRSVALLLMLLCSAVPLWAQPSYTVTRLEPLLAFGLAQPYVAGQHLQTGEAIRRNFLTGVDEILDTQGQGGAAVHVRADGASTGAIGSPFGPGATAAVWAPDGTPTFLELPNSVAVQQNAAGVVAVFSDGGCGADTWAVRWIPAAGLVECLGPLSSGGVGVDGQGRIWATSNSQVTVWDLDGTVITLGPGTFQAIDPDTAVAAITRSTSIPGGGLQAVRLSEAAGAEPLPNLRNLPFCIGRWIAPDGTIVGGCAQSLNLIFATLWTPNNQVIDLNDLADIQPTAEQQAIVIDAAGNIVVSILPTMPIQSRRSVLLRPVERQVAECGGDLVCRCGDTIVADYSLPGDLTCSVTGFAAALVVASNVSVKGNGFTVQGTGDGTGVLWDQARDSRLQNVTADGFFAAFKLRSGARDITLQNATARNSTLAMFFEDANHNKVTSSRLEGDVLLQRSTDNRFLGTCISGQVLEEDSSENVFKLVPCDPGRKKVASR